MKIPGKPGARKGGLQSATPLDPTMIAMAAAIMHQQGKFSDNVDQSSDGQAKPKSV